MNIISNKVKRYRDGRSELVEEIAQLKKGLLQKIQYNTKFQSPPKILSVAANLKGQNHQKDSERECNKSHIIITKFLDFQLKTN